MRRSGRWGAGPRGAFRSGHQVRGAERDLVRALRLDNAVHHLMLAHRFAAGHLMKATLQLIRSNKAAIWRASRMETAGPRAARTHLVG